MTIKPYLCHHTTSVLIGTFDAEPPIVKAHERCSGWRTSVVLRLKQLLGRGLKEPITKWEGGMTNTILYQAVKTLCKGFGLLLATIINPLDEQESSGTTSLLFPPQRLR